VALRVLVQTPYAASVCEMSLRGLGVGLVNPITALDYAERGLVVRRFSIDVSFTCLLALPAGKVLSATARDFISLMRLQLVEDEKRLQRYLR
jgi:DNA-binding transcriptional LysR family regulator